MPSNEERSRAYVEASMLGFSSPHAAFDAGWESRDAEVQQLREERDALIQAALDHRETASRALAERDRYAAVIEKSRKTFGDMPMSRGWGIALGLAAVDSGSALAERDAEKWDEGVKERSRTMRTLGDNEVLASNPYRAEQIRKEGK